MRYKLLQLAWNIVDWIYPPQCGGCEKLGTRWCSDCQDNVIVISPPICNSCGMPLPANGKCTSCRRSPPLCSAIRSWAVYEGPVRNAILRLKYQKDIGLGETLASHIIQTYLQTEWSVDTIVAVPLGSERKAQRGYNQAELLTRPLAWSLGLNYMSKALYRVRETRSQIDLTYLERRENVANAFRARRNLVSGKRILIVDDVTTSGSTLDACAEALLNENAKVVYGLTVARAIKAEF